MLDCITKHMAINAALNQLLFSLPLFWQQCSVFFAAAVLYCHCETAIVLISVQGQAMVKARHQQMFQRTIEEHVAEHVELWNGRVKVLEVSSSYKQ